MSADSPRRGLHKGAQVVSPQPISDRSIIDSVAGIINDIVPQAYAGAPNVDNKETITWARFEYADVNNSAFYPDYIEGSATPPLLLVLGYTTGVQVWVVAASGEATEVLSWRQWVVRTLRILPDPKTDEDNTDPFHEKRPMVAICDSAGPGPQFCSVSFVSLRTGEQAKSIKFKNPVCDVLANRRSVVVTFSEKIAVFDARTLEDVLTVTTCYPSPGPNPNPVALGTRWLAYSEKKLLPARRSSGGSEGEGVQSYTAAVLYAAKSLGKGLRGLGETVASSLTGNSSSPMAMNNVTGDVTQPGVVTILDLQASKEEKDMDDSSIETVVAHFTAHNDAIVAMTFDLTGALLMTADKRGHDFHVFRIQPHPGGPTLAAVHHLYVLHRGDTTAKVQDMTFSGDTRWAAVSTVRGTTHVFPVAPYGGPVGVRTHSTPHVVNRLSRFHRSAGLTDDSTRSHSPVSHAELPISVYPYTNPRLPPYPHPTILHPLAQIRQPSTLNHTNNQSQPSRPQQRQRLHSDDGGTLQLKICACFAPPRAWIYAQRDSTSKVAKRAVDSLFIMACHGNMIQYDLEPKPAAGVPKEKVCDDTTIELEVEAKGQWPLLRAPNSLEILTPLSSSSPLLTTLGSPKCSRQLDTADDRWLSQVEIVTHAGPHRRLWMGPQFIFKTYNAPSGVNLIESEAIEIGVTGGSRPARSNPVNMPHTAARPLVPLVIDGSGSSYEQSPRFMEAYGDSLENETMGIGNGENQLREDLAEAMLETSTAPHRVAGRRLVVERVGQPVTKVVNPLGTVITVMADEEDVSSSQEFDDPTPEPPRSLCAEEGPASLGDFDTERGQDLRNLTEICAEMRSASEPAIDSVPDESIKEVRVTKTLCAEAVTVAGHHERTIDYESAEAFRDVPTSLSLCAEQGEIPNSPMTMARETNWTRRTIRRDDDDLQERNYAKAKYIVNYDDDSVVLMENKASSSTGLQQSVAKKCTRPEVAAQRTTEPEPERASKRPSKVASSTRATKRSSCATQPKYLVHEHEDSIVIEDTSTDARSNDRPENVDERENGSAKSASLVEATRQSPTYASAADEAETRQRRVKERRNSKNSRILEAMVVESRPFENADNFVDLEASEALVIVETRENDHEPMEATVATGLAALPLVETQLRPATVISDDASCMDYHIVETGFLPIRGDTTCSQQSDDDIEHIHSSEVTQMLEILDGKLATCREDLATRVRERKGSAISDDDMEHINGAELAEDVLEQTREREDLEDFSASNYTRASKSALSFDDDIEHVYHSEINELELPAAQGVLDSPETRVAKKKTQENASGKERSPSLRTRGSRKRKDVVVIDSDNSEAEVTVIVKSTDSWSRSKTPDKDANEDKEGGCPEAKESGNEQPSLQSLPSLPSLQNLPSLQSLPKKTRVRTPKGNATTIPPTTTNASQKRQPPDTVEIIDIDAMQKAEMEVASSIVTPECKILEARRDANPPRSQKSRRSKKAHLDNNSTIMATAESLPAPEEASTSPPRVQESDLADPPIEVPEPRDTEAVLDVPEASKDENVEQASNVPVRKSKSSESRTPSVEEKVTGTKKRGKKSRVGVNEVAVPPASINSAEELAHVVENLREETSLPVGNEIPEPEQAISSLEVPNDVKMSDETSAGYEPREVDAASTITKNRSPEPEVQDEIEQETEKPTDSDLDGQPERSSSSDDLNANVVPMDTEEDAAVREIAEKIGPNALSPSWPTVNKKNTRSKKKKRR